RADHVSRKRQNGIVQRCVLLKVRMVDISFRSFYAFIGNHIGVSSRPTAGNGAAMEVYQELVIGCVLKYIQIKLHEILLVTTEKIDLYSLDAKLRYPSHLSSPDFAVVHFVARTCIDP